MTRSGWRAAPARAARSSPTVLTFVAEARAVVAAEEGRSAGPVPAGDVVVRLVGAVDGALDGVAVVVHDDDHRREPLAEDRRQLLRGHLRGAVADQQDAAVPGPRGTGPEQRRERVADRRPQRLADEGHARGQAVGRHAVEAGALVGEHDVARPQERAASRHSAFCPSGASSAAGCRLGSRWRGAGAADRSTSGDERLQRRERGRQLQRREGRRPDAPERAPTSTVRARVICWLNSPLFRSVNCTPATISAAASSRRARWRSGCRGSRVGPGEVGCALVDQALRPRGRRVRQGPAASSRAAVARRRAGGPAARRARDVVGRPTARSEETPRASTKASSASGSVGSRARAARQRPCRSAPAATSAGRSEVTGQAAVADGGEHPVDLGDRSPRSAPPGRR